MRDTRWLWRDERGGVAILAAVTGGMICALAALAVDLASIALNARTLQGAADLAALAAVSDMGRATQAAEATARANLSRTLEDVSVEAVTGVYRADRALAPAARFSSGGEDRNAARVTLEGSAPLYFGRWILGRESLALRRTGMAARPARPKAMFSIGSRLARLDGGVANQLLSGLTGSQVSLTAADYRALADAEVNLLGFSDALATRLDLEAGDYRGVLDARIDAGEALKLIEGLVDGGTGALDKLASAADGLTIDIGGLIGAETDVPGGLKGGLNATVSALDLATAILEVGGKDRQIALDLGVPAGLAALDVSLAIGERPNGSPWLTVTDDGAPIIRTAQARLHVRARTAQKLSGLARVDLPILVELAASEARLEGVSCGPDRSVTLGVRPGVARAMIGVIDERSLKDFKTPLRPTRATFLDVAGLVTLKGKADIEAADKGFTPVTFSAADIAAKRTKTATSKTFASGLVSSLLERLDIEVGVIGLDLGLGDLTRALGALLAPIGGVLDAVLMPVLETLGLRLGEADVAVHGLYCPDARTSAPTLVG